MSPDMGTALQISLGINVLRRARYINWKIERREIMTISGFQQIPEEHLAEIIKIVFYLLYLYFCLFF